MLTLGCLPCAGGGSPRASAHGFHTSHFTQQELQTQCVIFWGGVGDVKLMPAPNWRDSLKLMMMSKISSCGGGLHTERWVFTESRTSSSELSTPHNQEPILALERYLLIIYVYV